MNKNSHSAGRFSTRKSPAEVDAQFGRLVREGWVAVGARRMATVDDGRRRGVLIDLPVHIVAEQGTRSGRKVWSAKLVINGKVSPVIVLVALAEDGKMEEVAS